MHHRRTIDAAAAGGGATAVPYGRDAPPKRTKRRKRRARPGIRRAASPMQDLLLPAIFLFGILWIRRCREVGRTRGKEAAKEDHPPFRLRSEEAPACEDVGSPDDVDVTLVTQLSDDRLWMMEHHCARYGPHPMSVAVYSNSTPKSVADDLSGLGCNIEGWSATHEQGATVALEVLDARVHGAWNDYPVNALRNLALGGVRTTHVAYVDVDFWPSEGLYEAVLGVRERLREDPRLALVIPAFQLNRGEDCWDWTVDCREDNVPRMPFSIPDLARTIRTGEVSVFDPSNGGGHGSTDYDHWLRYQLDPEPEDALHAIPCLKSRRYEPFVTIRYCRELTPPFQAAFSGYGKNKMTWMMQVVASGFELHQIGGAYLVHYPHAVSTSREEWNRAPKELVPPDADDATYSVRRPRKSDGDLGFQRYHRGKVDDLYIRFKEWLRRSIPQDRARMELCDDAQDDDTKLWIDPKRKNWDAE